MVTTTFTQAAEVALHGVNQVAQTLTLLVVLEEAVEVAQLLKLFLLLLFLLAAEVLVMLEEMV
jgi:hypothetical protein